MPKVDVVVPFYNTPVEFTRTALESVFAQTYSDWKIVLVNDGSNGSSTRALEELLPQFDTSRITYIQQTNKGLPGARNTAIRASDAPYTATLDSDDAWYPDKLHKQVTLLDRRQDLGVIHAGMDLLYPTGIVPHRSGTWPARGECKGEHFFIRMLSRNIVAGPSSTMFRRSSSEAVGHFDDGFESLEDKDLWLRLIIGGCTFLYIDEPLAIYRQHASNMSKNADKMWRGRMRLIEKHVTLVPHFPGDWSSVDWPVLRRHMLHHAYRELSETCLEAGEYSRAYKYSMPWYSGAARESLLLTARSIYRTTVSAIGVRK